MLRNGQAGELTNGGIEVRVIDRRLAARARLCHTGGDDGHGGARGLLPQGKLPPVLLFTEMPAMVRPPHDDGFVLPRARIKAIEQTADLVIQERNGGQVGLHGLLPLIAV